MNQRVCRAIGKVLGQIRASHFPDLPLFWTEWNVRGDNELRDTTYVAPALAYDIAQCDGLVDMMSYWTFDDVFEEGGVPPDPFHGGFGLIAVGGIKKPSYFGFSLLHKLGTERLSNSASGVLATRRADGTLVVAVWNLVEPEEKGAPKPARLQFRNTNPSGTVLISRADESHGNTLAAYRKMGSPQYPTQAQVEQINREGELPPPEAVQLRNGAIAIDIPPNGLAVLELPK